MAKLVMTVEEMKDRQAWLKLRNSGLGGSDASVIMGMNPWKSRLALWAEKTGETEPADLSDNMRVYFGTQLEPIVAEWFTKVTGKQVRRRGMMQSCDHPWMLASLDREVVGEKAGLEIKTAGVDQAKYWKDDNVPDAYYLQCQWYMACTGYERWYIAVLIGGNDARWNVVERNEEQIKALVEEGQKFWNLIEKRIPPEPDGSDSAGETLEDIYPGGAAGSIALDGMAGVLESLKRFEAAEKEAKAAKEECRQKIMAAMGNFEAATIGNVKVTWKTQAGRVTLDTKKLKAEMPDIYKKYTKTGKPTRVLRT